ncbi:hypothetical protein FJZ31_12120 [Candidatus Poribacteria bacterium]|nr:hypothetical protein [Candidatus Poribacteria bacterium]
MELIQQISQLPEQKLGEVETFLKRILSQLKVEPPKPISLKGIWKNKGLEKISDLESEIKLIRSERSDSILKKEF